MPQSKESRRESAAARKGAWQALSPEEQLKQLDNVLGVGRGAKKQRARIQAALLKKTAGK